MKKKNILITGFDGFLGSNLLKKIDLNKYCIYGIGYTRKKLNKNFFLNRKITYTNLSFFKKKNISIIIHCAGSSMVGLNYQNDFKKNVLTTYEILEFSKSLKLMNVKNLFSGLKELFQSIKNSFKTTANQE